MNKKIKLSALFIIALLAVPQLSQGAHPVFKGSFLPPNNLRISVNSLAAKGLTEKQFNAVIDEIEAIYTPIVAAKGAKLVINRLWDDPTVNSDAEEENDKWIINSYGGLARDQHITQDGFALVACHEMGHHLGGAPKYNGGGDWASNEGEADYFSTSKCLHLMFSSPASKHFTHTSAGNDLAIAKAACAKSYPKWHWKARAVCVRSAMAGLSVTGLLAELSQDSTPAHFNTPDPTIVAETNDDHPASQCRLDTYFQGALCNKSYMIPMDNNNPVTGACVLSQGYTVGMRPLCWYKPTPAELPHPIHISTPSQILAAFKNPGLWKLN